MSTITLKNNLILTDKQKIKSSLEVALLILVVILQIVWPLPSTIAMRNFCLIGGAFLSLLLILFFREKTILSFNIPTILIASIPFWLFIHYVFLQTDLKRQWYDLSGTWLRVSCGILVSISLGQILFLKPNKARWIYFTYVLMGLLSILFFVRASSLQHNIVVPGFTSFFKTKISVAYFTVFTCLMTCGLFLTTKNDSQKGRLFKPFTVYFLVTTVCLVVCISVQSLIGVLFCIFTILTTGCFMVVKSNYLSKARISLIPFLLIFLTVCAFVAFYQYDKKYEGKLSHLKNDIVLSYDIDKNLTWSRSNSVANLPDPVNSDGRTVNVSTYERVSWMRKGIRILVANPLGAGFSWSAFRYYMTKEYPGTTVDKTHSGWLDFAIGVGFPGLFLAWASIIMISRQAILLLKGPFENSHQLIVLYVLLGMSLLWFVAEVCEREFIEHFFFFISLSASYVYASKHHQERV
jgi:hypothetical protein